MHSGDSICDMVVFSSSVFNGAVEGTEKVLPSPKFLAFCCSLYEGEQEVVINENYEVVSSQLSFKKV